MTSGTEYPTAPAPTRIRRRAIRAIAMITALTAAVTALSAGVAGAAVKDVTLTAKQAVVEVAPGVKMRAWTFNGTVPAPAIHVTEGDTVNVTLVNGDKGTPATTKRVKRKKCKWVRVKKRLKKAPKRGRKFRWVKKKRCGMKKVKVKVPGRPAMPHSIDFHAAEIAPNIAFKSIPPGRSHSFSFTAHRAGVYMYHCGTPMMLEHIALGMYGAIVVDPAVPEVSPALEVDLVQSEFYGKVKGGWLEPDVDAMLNGSPKYVTFNGRANRYVEAPFDVNAGDLVKVNVVNAGPSNFSAFHIVGTIFDEYWPDGRSAGKVKDVSTQTVPPGGGASFLVRFAEPGKYPVVTHSMRDMEKGAMGFFRVK